MGEQRKAFSTHLLLPASYRWFFHQVNYFQFQAPTLSN